MDRSRPRLAPRLALQLAAASSLILVGSTVGAQAPTGRVAHDRPSAAARVAVPLATRPAARAGVSVAAVPRALTPDSTATGTQGNHRARHVVVGAGIGLVAGAAIGAGIGAYEDSHDRSESMIPAAGVLGVLGAGIGLLIGGIVGALDP